MAAILTECSVYECMANLRGEDDGGKAANDGCQELEQKYQNDNVGQKPSRLLPSEQEKDDNGMRKSEVDLPPAEEEQNPSSLQKKIGEKSSPDAEVHQNCERRCIAEECHRAMIIAQEKRKTRLQSYERSSCLAADRRGFAEVVRMVPAERWFCMEGGLGADLVGGSDVPEDSEMVWRERMGRMERELGEFVGRERRDVERVQRELERRDRWRFEAGFISAREMDELLKLREERNSRREGLVRT